MHRATIAGGLAMSVLACSLPAQKTFNRSASVDVSIGMGKGWGGNYDGRGGLAGELTFVSPHATSWFGAFSVGAQGRVPATGDCTIDVETLRCIPLFPAKVHAAL